MKSKDIHKYYVRAGVPMHPDTMPSEIDVEEDYETDELEGEQHGGD